MEAISSSIATCTNSSFSCRRRIVKPYLPTKLKSTVRFRPVSAKRGEEGPESGNGFGLVDENMIVLRIRIRDMEMAEGSYEPPSQWTEWEKRYHNKYGSDVCRFVGLVQILLMKTRPGLAIGLAGLMAMSLPASVVLIWIHLVEAMKLFGVIGG